MENKNLSKKSNYYSWSNFEAVYFEDSYVLSVDENPTQIIFHLDLVLTEDHPLFTMPKQGEQYCYKKANLIFSKISSANWTEKKFQPSQDANGEIDFGNIDGFYLEDGRYHIFGEWGYLIVESSDPQLTFD